MYCGWRARIGLIMPGNGTNPEYEFHKYAPEGVTVMTQRVLFERVDPEGLREMGGRIDSAAKLLATAHPDLVLFGCTSGSLIGGFGYDLELIKRMEGQCGAKALTTSSAVLMALKALGAKRVVVATPYVDRVNEIEKKMYHLTKEVLNPAADAIFVSCTGLGIAHGINMMERDFGLPVVTSNQASLWGALRSLSIKDDVGLGKLFTL